jgi:RNA polymerase-binding transcription factor DksA
VDHLRHRAVGPLHPAAPLTPRIQAPARTVSAALAGQETMISRPDTGSMMHREARSPHWRTLLEARWQERLQEVTELSLAYHGAAAARQPGQQETQRLLRRTVAARRKLADTEEALGRLATGDFGHCEQCGSLIPAGLLLAIPESRYCPGCTAEPTPAWPRTAAGLGRI